MCLKKPLVILGLLLLIAGNALAADVSDKKTLAQYLLFKKNITKAKSAAWLLASEARDLGRVEKWSSRQLRQELAETESLNKSLPRSVKIFSLYDASELENDLANLDAANQKISAARKNIANRSEVHQKIKQQIQLCKKDAAIA